MKKKSLLKFKEKVFDKITLGFQNPKIETEYSKRNEKSLSRLNKYLSVAFLILSMAILSGVLVLKDNLQTEIRKNKFSLHKLTIEMLDKVNGLKSSTLGDTENLQKINIEAKLGGKVEHHSTIYYNKYVLLNETIIKQIESSSINEEAFLINEGRINTNHLELVKQILFLKLVIPLIIITVFIYLILLITSQYSPHDVVQNVSFCFIYFFFGLNFHIISGIIHSFFILNSDFLLFLLMAFQMLLKILLIFSIKFNWIKILITSLLTILCEWMFLLLVHYAMNPTIIFYFCVNTLIHISCVILSYHNEFNSKYKFFLLRNLNFEKEYLINFLYFMDQGFITYNNRQILFLNKRMNKILREYTNSNMMSILSDESTYTANNREESFIENENETSFKKQKFNENIEFLHSNTFKQKIKSNSKSLVEKVMENMSEINNDLPVEIINLFAKNYKYLKNKNFDLEKLFNIVKNKEEYKQFISLGIVTINNSSCTNYSNNSNNYNNTMEEEKNKFSHDQRISKNYNITFRVVAYEDTDEYLEIMFTDITKLIQNEAEKAVSYSRSAYISKISHEFKNPLSSLSELSTSIKEEIQNFIYYNDNKPNSNSSNPNTSSEQGSPNSQGSKEIYSSNFYESTEANLHSVSGNLTNIQNLQNEQNKKNTQGQPNYHFFPDTPIKINPHNYNKKNKQKIKNKKQNRNFMILQNYKQYANSNISPTNYSLPNYNKNKYNNNEKNYFLKNIHHYADHADNIYKSMLQFLKDFSLLTNLKFSCDTPCNPSYFTECKICNWNKLCQKCNICKNCEMDQHTTFDFIQVIQEHIDAFKDLGQFEEKDHSILLNIQMNSNEIKTNRKLFSSIIYNLILHAYKASNSGGKIIINIKKIYNNSNVVFEIQHEGLEIDRIFLDKLYNDSDNKVNFHANKYEDIEKDILNKYFNLNLSFNILKKLYSKMKIESNKKMNRFTFSIRNEIVEKHYFSKFEYNNLYVDLRKKESSKYICKYCDQNNKMRESKKQIFNEDVVKSDHESELEPMIDENDFFDEKNRSSENEVKLFNETFLKNFEKNKIHDKNLFFSKELPGNKFTSEDSFKKISITKNNNKFYFLLVDDENLVRNVIKRHLLKISEKTNLIFEIEEASNCFEALDIIYKNFSRKDKIIFDFLIIDEQMPNMKGSTLIRLLKQLKNENNLYSMVIISHTAFDSNEKKKIILESGADLMLGKPAHLNELKDIIEKMI